jgi:hypothetical protein
VKARNLAVLVVLAIVLVAAAYWSSNRQRASTAAPELGVKLFPGLALNDVAKIVVRSPSATATVARVNGIWSAVDRFNYPATFDKVSDLLRRLGELGVGQVIRAAPAELAGLNLVPPAPGAASAAPGATVVELFDQAGKPMASLRIGKEHITAPPRGAAAPSGFGGYPDGRYVAKDNEHVYLVSDTLDQATPDLKSWMDEDFLNVTESDVATVDVTGGTNAPLHLARPGGTGPLELPTIPAGQEMDAAKVSRVAGALGYLRYDDVADPTLAPAVTGLDQPATFKCKTSKGEVYTLRIGKSPKDDARRYVGVTVAFEPPPTGAVSAATSTDTNKLAEAKAEEAARQATATAVTKLNAKLSPWIYLLSASQVEPMLMPAADLLKVKPPPEPEKKAATNAPAPAAANTPTPAATNNPPGDAQEAAAPAATNSAPAKP